MLVNQAGDGVFAAAFFSQDENGNVGFRQQLHLSAQLLRCGAGADEKGVGTDLFNILAVHFGVRGFTSGQIAADGGLQGSFIEGSN